MTVFAQIQAADINKTKDVLPVQDIGVLFAYYLNKILVSFFKTSLSYYTIWLDFIIDVFILLFR